MCLSCANKHCDSYFCHREECRCCNLSLLVLSEWKTQLCSGNDILQIGLQRLIGIQGASLSSFFFFFSLSPLRPSLAHSDPLPRLSPCILISPSRAPSCGHFQLWRLSKMSLLITFNLATDSSASIRSARQFFHNYNFFFFYNRFYNFIYFSSLRTRFQLWIQFMEINSFYYKIQPSLALSVSVSSPWHLAQRVTTEPTSFLIHDS